jgi:archaellum biogenesis protein FlaJ (TadC family)
MRSERRTKKSITPVERKKSFVKGEAPHRKRNAYKAGRKWSYYNAAMLWLLAVCLSFLTIAVFGFGVWQKDGVIMSAGLGIFFVWLITKLMFFFASKATTCPLCRASHFGNSKSVKHKKAYKIFPLSYLSTAVVTAILIRCVRCMHCGVTFDLNKTHR